MTHKTTRIVLTDPTLLQALQKVRAPAEFVLCSARDLAAQVGEADLFLLDDDTAIRFLGARAEAEWPSVVVAARDGDPLPASFRQGLVDDLLLVPPRALDVERMLATHQTMKALHELEASSHNVGELVRQLQEDILLAQKIQRRLIREKFQPLGPLAVRSKYWCGLKAGGDYFDFFEFPGGTHAGLILSDSSSYALSTALIGSLVQFSVHAGRDELENPARIVQTLFGKVKETMKEKDRLSLLYGVLDRKTYAWKFVSCGGVYVARRDREGKVEWASRGEHAPLSLEQPMVPEARELVLHPGDRMMVCSDGWGEALAEDMPAVMERFLGHEEDSAELLNELAFTLRRKLEKEEEEPVTAASEFPMPPQDCSVLVFELAANTLRLAK